MGFDEWEPFSFQLKKHMEYVHRHFMIPFWRPKTKTIRQMVKRKL